MWVFEVILQHLYLITEVRKGAALIWEGRIIYNVPVKDVQFTVGHSILWTKIIIYFISKFCSKFWGQWDLFFKEINTFIQQWCIKVIKSDSKDIYNITKKKIYMMLFYAIKSKNPRIKASWFLDKYSSAQGALNHRNKLHFKIYSNRKLFV